MPGGHSRKVDDSLCLAAIEVGSRDVCRFKVCSSIGEAAHLKGSSWHNCRCNRAPCGFACFVSRHWGKTASFALVWVIQRNHHFFSSGYFLNNARVIREWNQKFPKARTRQKIENNINEHACVETSGLKNIMLDEMNTMQKGTRPQDQPSGY